MLVVINLQRCIRQQCAVSCELVVEEDVLFKTKNRS